MESASRGNLLDTNSASAMLGCTPAALVKFRTERRGPAYVKVGRLIRYRGLELVRWIQAQRVSPDQARRRGANNA
jgi:hypothetical protein